jgi:microcystin-dependent protein
MASTGVTGGGQPFDNTQPSLAVHYIIDINRSAKFPSREGDGTTESPLLGEIDLFAGSFAPRGWAFCDGQVLKIDQDIPLFSIIGTTYGGDGKTTFALPDLQDRAVVGTGKGPGLTNRPLGEPFGKDRVVVSVQQIPPHAHTLPGGGMTGVTGGGQPFDNTQPSMALQYLISPFGHPDFAQIRMFAGNFAPDGYLLCDGQILPIAQHQELFKLLGTIYGSNGTTTFALPDLRGRLDIGTGQVPGGSLRTLGESTGQEAVTLSVAQLPPHSHTLPGGGATGTTGGGQSFDNTQPSLAMIYAIATRGFFPAREFLSDNAGGITPFLGEIRAFTTTDIPTGWAPANGQLLPIERNQALFSILGTIYGGDGIKTFALPNLNGRVPVGAGAGQQTRSLGDEFGTRLLTLTAAQLPPHSHELPATPAPQARA